MFFYCWYKVQSLPWKYLKIICSDWWCSPDLSWVFAVSLLSYAKPSGDWHTVLRNLCYCCLYLVTLSSVILGHVPNFHISFYGDSSNGHDNVQVSKRKRNPMNIGSLLLVYIQSMFLYKVFAFRQLFVTLVADLNTLKVVELLVHQGNSSWAADYWVQKLGRGLY